MVVTEVPIAAVLSLDQSQQWGDPSAPVSVVLRPGAEEDGSIYLVSEGLFGRALEKLQDVLRSGTEGDDFYDEFEEEEEDFYYDGRRGRDEFGGRRRRRSAAASAAAPSSPSSRGGGRQQQRVDPQFEAWREVHGQVFARYYGLPSVPRTRAELDRAMAAAADPSSSSQQQPQPQRRQAARQRSPSPSAAPPRTRQQQQQQQRAALPPPSRGSFSDALRPAERAFETVDALMMAACCWRSSMYE